jgi:iron complex outermembrane receptor protein
MHHVLPKWVAQSSARRASLIGVLYLVFVNVVASAAPQARDDRQIDGLVVDSQNLPIAGARITLTDKQGSVRKSAVTTTDRFHLDGLAAAVYDLHIEADGFDAQTITADLRTQPSTTFEIRMEPEHLSQEVIVAATRTEQRLGDVPASASVVRGEDIKESPAVVMDDVLRQAPTFSLFRRTSSLAAHPTSQGVSLRGIGPSGVSRTLVLLDNIPFNDPFGGWVYWTRAPRIDLDRIEMVDGATSSVYGNYAMGGVINIMTNRPQRRTFILKPQYGGRRNPRIGSTGDVWDGLGSGDFFASDVFGNLGAAVEGSTFNTNGYPIVTPTRRGPVDTKATLDYQNLNVKLDYSPSDRVNAFFRSGYYRENRSNAKICVQAPISCEEANDTLWKFLSGGVRIRMPDQSDLQARVFGNFETFHSSFLAIPDSGTTRATGRLSLLQRVPTKDAGFMTQWSKALPGRQYFTAGLDWRWVDGNSNEDSFNQTTELVTLRRISGGTQQSLGVFLQDLIAVTPRLQLTLSVRVDHWRNYDGHNLETGIGANNKPTCEGSSLTPPACIPDKKNTVGSPHGGALYRVSDKVSVWGGMSWGFRAPTLNELYRQFRVGAILTLANENLGPERLVGWESGVNVAPLRNLTWRTTWFLNRFTNPVSNVTLPAPANTRQRQNLGRTRIYGLQTDVEYRPSSYWRFGGAYLYDMATVREFPADPSLVGKLLPQVPKHRGSLQAAYSNPRLATLAAQANFVSLQFDGDQNTVDYLNEVNTQLLPGYGALDVNASRTISHNLEAFFGVQNLFNRQFLVQRNPTTVGAPRLFTGGLRLSFVGR